MATQNTRMECRQVKSFEYPACPGADPEPVWEGWIETHSEEKSGGSTNFTVPNGREDRERLAAETRRAFEAGREEGRRFERESMASTSAKEAEHWRRQTAALVEQVTQERDRYLRAIEQEVVRLALAVAARILRREAQMDPLLLTGAVRVALGQLAATSEIRIRVPAKEADLWAETIEHLPNLPMKPLVVSEEKMLLGDCRIESKVGTVDLGIRAQLSEIEKGFFDRARAVHAAAPEPSAEVRT